MRILHTILSHWGAGDPNDRLALRHSYIMHYAHVRRVVLQSRLLEFEAGDGWVPLCAFLGKEVPQEEYPRVNDAKATVRLHGFLLWYRAWRMSRGWIVVGSALAVLVFAVWWRG